MMKKKGMLPRLEAVWPVCSYDLFKLPCAHPCSIVVVQDDTAAGTAEKEKEEEEDDDEDDDDDDEPENFMLVPEGWAQVVTRGLVLY